MIESLPPADRPEQPELPDWLFWVWRAFDRLTHERQWIGGGMGPAMPGRIPWSAIQAWSDRHGYSGEDAKLFDVAIQAMDEAYCEWLAMDVERKRSKK